MTFLSPRIADASAAARAAYYRVWFIPTEAGTD